MLRRLLLLMMLPVVWLTAWAHPSDSTLTDSARLPGRRWSTSVSQQVVRTVKGFSHIDTTYIEPQHYNYTVMLQNTNTFEVYHLRNARGQEIVFSPTPAIKLGPYVGWRWVFLGYTFDIAHRGGGDGRQDFNLSLYSNQIGADIFYRKSGNAYRIRSISVEPGQKAEEVHNVPFSGFESSIKGFNLYYIFNHHRFSYPAAYSQSTVQRRSAGSVIAGIGYTRHKLSVDWQGVYELLDARGYGAETSGEVDTTMMVTGVEYSDYSLSGGYAYNWVFAHNWLFDISLQAALSYNHSESDTQTTENNFFRSFDFKNINLNGILRTGIVWNNTRWYAGANSVFHAYNYKKSRFSTNNIFGSVNIYVGFNFGRK